MKVTKRQLLKIIREEAAGNFGGGEETAEAFVDMEDEDLNQNQEPGVVSDIEVIPERRTVKMTRRQLQRLISEQAGGGLPSVDDLAKKLGAAGPEATIDFITRLLQKANFAGGGEDVELPPEEPVPPVAPPAPDEEI